MKQRRFWNGQRWGQKAKWGLAALVGLVALVPSLWLAALEFRTSDRLIGEIDRGLRADAAFFGERLVALSEQVLLDENVRPVLEASGYLVPDTLAPGGAFYATNVAPPLTDVVAYGFFVDYADTSVFVSRQALPDADVQAVMAASRQTAAAGGALHVGRLARPEGDFLYAALTDVSPGGRQVLRGVRINPEAVRLQVLPEAFLRLREEVAPQRGRGDFPGALFGFEVLGPERLLVLHDLDQNGSAVRTLELPLTLGGLFPSWTLRVRYYNELAATRWRRSLAALVPLLIVIMGVFFTARMTMREVELSRTKSIFVSNVSHELKTPITKIRLFNELLRGAPEASDKRLRYHHVIEQECARLVQLVDNVLDFGRIERGQRTYTLTDTPLEDVVVEVVETCNVLYGPRGYHIDLAIDPDLPDVLIDPGALHQALVNLIDNAVKYSEPHTIAVRVGRARWGERPAVALVVEDQGIGIPAAKRDYVFNEFYRVESGLAQRASGSGLGLALVRHIAEGHGGTVKLESEVGKGSTFTILLPIRKPDKPAFRT